MLRTEHKLYRVYYAMRQRCNNPKDCNYHKYGGRGITLCEEWANSYDAFMQWALDNGYKEGLQVDRVNNNEGYSPNNCRWVTPKVNGNNTRRTIMVTYMGETRPLTEWAEIRGIKIGTLRSRLQELKLPVEEALQPKKLYRGFVTK